MCFVSQLALAGIGSLAFDTLTPQPTLAASAITLKASFDGANGRAPFAALTPAGNGLFYGTTFSGVDNNVGSIFEFNSSGSGSITLKASFDGATGDTPIAALTPVGNGLFYGTAFYGGANGAGSIFEFDPSGSGSITLKASFDFANGAYPFAALTPAGNGLFYGTASRGGANDLGSIFEFDPSGGGSITLKASFDGANGNGPHSALTPAGNGLFYGTAYAGGANSFGSIFEFDPSGGGITLKASFDGANGVFPEAALMPAGNGLFYGTATGGGANDRGSIFEFDPSGGGITLKASFDGANGRFPAAALTPAGIGLFYGIAAQGGANDAGSIFEFDPSGGGITLKASFDGATGADPFFPSFDGANGAYPFAALTPAGNGLFYGTASRGGANDRGSIFEFDPNSGSTAVPGHLPILGVAAAFGYSRKLRKRIKSSKPEVISTTAV